jgi:hypothetical protein
MYWDWRGRIFNFLNKSLHESLLLHPVMNLIIFFCILKIFTLCEQLNNLPSNTLRSKLVCCTIHNHLHLDMVSLKLVVKKRVGENLNLPTGLLVCTTYEVGQKMSYHNSCGNAFNWIITLPDNEGTYLYDFSTQLPHPSRHVSYLIYLLVVHFTTRFSKASNDRVVCEWWTAKY